MVDGLWMESEDGCGGKKGKDCSGKGQFGGFMWAVKKAQELLPSQKWP